MGKQACARRWAEYGLKLCGRSAWASVKPVFSYIVDFHAVPVTWRSEPSLKLCFKRRCKRINAKRRRFPSSSLLEAPVQEDLCSCRSATLIWHLKMCLR